MPTASDYGNKVNAYFLATYGVDANSNEIDYWTNQLSENTGNVWAGLQQSISVDKGWGYGPVASSVATTQVDEVLGNLFGSSSISSSLSQHYVDALVEGTIHPRGLVNAVLNDLGIMPKVDGSFGKPAGWGYGPGEGLLTSSQLDHYYSEVDDWTNSTSSSPMVSISATNDTDQYEGDSGTTAFEFDVTRSGDTSEAGYVNYFVSGDDSGGADPAESSDFYSYTSGSVYFESGQTSQSITVSASGDTTVEENEQFTVSIDPQNSSWSTGVSSVSCTILDDDGSGGPAPSPSDSVPGDSSTTQTLSIGIPQTDTIETSGDSDWYRMSVTSGNEYTISLDGFDGGSSISGFLGTSLHDTYLRVYDDSSSQIAYDDDDGPGLYSELTFTADYTGIVYVAAEGYRSNTGDYELYASEEENDSFCMATEGTISEGGTRYDSITSSSDSDAWGFVAPRSGYYDINVWRTDTNFDPTFTVYNSSCSRIAYDDDGGTGYNSHEEVYMSAGNYVISVAGWSSSTGDYGLSVEWA
jgi:hypothetical protein